MPKKRMPSVDFFADDWIGGTYRMSRLERGGYIDLLVAQVQEKGFLTEEIIREILGDDYDVLWPKLRQKFIEKGGKIWNERMLHEIQRRQAYSKSRSSNGKGDRSTCKAHAKHMKSICSTHAEHIGDGDGDGEGDGEGSGDGDLCSQDSLNGKKTTRRDCVRDGTYKAATDRMIERLQESGRRPTLTAARLASWDRQARLMCERDGWTLPDVLALIDEVHSMPRTASGFSWADNVLSIGTLRQRAAEGKIYLGMTDKAKGQGAQQHRYGRQELSREEVSQSLQWRPPEEREGNG